VVKKKRETPMNASSSKYYSLEKKALDELFGLESS
jgi:hypothetical protein